MAQIKYSVNLSAADFTLSFSYKGPSVIIPAGDQNYYQATADWAGATPQRGVNIPQVMYCENTVPTAEGYRSVAYKWFIEPAEPLEQRFVKMFPLFEGTGASAVLGLTADRKLYAVSALTGGEWKLVPLNDDDDPATDPILPFDTPGQITYATVTGAAVVCIQGIGFFKFNFITAALDYAPADGLDATKIRGICASSGYLIAWDDTTIYWSSTEHPLDFVPSLITGAGSAMVDGLKGTIRLCKEINGGFLIYTDVSIISAAYTANAALPWVFEVLAGGAGIRNADHVAHDINTQIHFAWTTAGLIGVELHQAKPMFPQLTDFIASGISDETTDLTAYPTLKWEDEYKEVRIAIVSSRYMCISFGKGNAALPDEYATTDLEQAFVYDLQLRRWGKLNIDHVQIFEAPFVAEDAFFLVSHLYPLEVFDSGTSSAEVVRGYWSSFENSPTGTTGTSSGQLIAGNLRDVYKETTILEEGHSDGALIEGDLYSVIKFYTTTEAGESFGELIASAYLNNIFYTRFEDAGTSDGLLVGATLS